jgi:transposase
LSKRLLPLLPAGLQVQQILPGPDRLTIVAVSSGSSVACPTCGTASERVHSYYCRSLGDLPWQGQPVTLRVRVRRLRCHNLACKRQTFAERLVGIAPHAGRRTARLTTVQRCVGVALGGESGARLAGRLAMPTSPDTLLRLAVAAGTARADIAHPATRVLGVDDWAWCRGQRYGTILVDLERNRVLDLLPGRQAETLAAWLRAHPGIGIVARDRASAYADGITQGAPDAVQVADRWHLLRNLGEAMQGMVDRHRGAVREAARAVADELAAPAQPSPVPATREERRAERSRHRRLRYEEMARLQRLGLPGHAIGRAIGASALTVYRWLKAGGPPAHDKPEQPRNIAPHEAFLTRRWADGCRNGARLWRELRVQGYQGAERSVVRWTTRQRRRECSGETDAVRRAAAWPPPSSRRCARLLGMAPDRLEAQQRTFLGHLTGIVPDLIRAGELAKAFVELLRERHPDITHAGAALTAWMTTARDSGLSSFARGLERDTDAVIAAMTTPWTTSPVEGQINRLKTIKRTMYGRAGFDLLRARVLQAA